MGYRMVVLLQIKFTMIHWEIDVIVCNIFDSVILKSLNVETVVCQILGEFVNTVKWKSKYVLW
jgi:hypothetical protein